MLIAELCQLFRVAMQLVVHLYLILIHDSHAVLEMLTDHLAVEENILNQSVK